jgi:ribosome-associated protein
LIRIDGKFEIEERELEWRFVRASGPGGQNVNKVSTAVELRFNVESSATLPDEAKVRLRRLAGTRMSDEGVLVIQAQRFRSQVRNREDALARLLALLQQALHRPRRRIATRPTLASRERRIVAKKQRAQRKAVRGRVRDSD